MASQLFAPVEGVQPILAGDARLNPSSYTGDCRVVDVDSVLDGLWLHNTFQARGLLQMIATHTLAGGSKEP